ncbi:transporter substrate-binding domain-containing protein [Butyrivibrio sp. LC3010]|uniref:transporter substrate-binding domain-containing protein n=1 Tax=Butyrivibrio sp. LC3010 TaxID=1280680 RepID=UPI0004293D20|nr:transporter substrate-binding domain-containing protein [Butyrivibrio sp. LC3010]
MRKRVLSTLLIVALSTLMLVACSNKKDSLVGSDAKAGNSNIKVIDILLTEEEYGIGVDKNKPELLEAINSFIEEGLTNGKYEEITGHYFGGEGEPVPIYSADKDKSKDQLIVATTGDFEPFDYDDGDKHYGIDKELINAIAESLGKELVLEYINFEILFATVNQGKCDVCIAGITINDERKEYVDFSIPYFHAGQCLATRKDNTELDYAKTLEDIEKKLLEFDENVVIAVETETTGEDYLNGKEGTFEGVKCKILRCPTLRDCLIELNNGNADYVIGDSAVLKYLIANG